MFVFFIKILWWIKGTYNKEIIGKKTSRKFPNSVLFLPFRLAISLRLAVAKTSYLTQNIKAAVYCTNMSIFRKNADRTM